MNKLKKYIEILFLVLIHLLFTFNAFAMLSIMAVSSLLSVILFNANPVYENDSYFFLLTLLLGLLYLILKVILFPILYNFEKILPYTHKFFNIIFGTNKLAIITFSLIFLFVFLDIISYTIFFRENISTSFWGELLFGLGLLPSYLVMYFVVKKHKNQKQM